MEIALRTGRTKDFARVMLFLEENEVEDVLRIDGAKTAFNARSKAAMRAYLKSHTCPEKIESIERMNEAAQLAREGMRRTREAGTKR
jgi:hypothetical protein